jgi:hypothetical protein
MTGELLYLYAVVPAPAAHEGLAGIDGEPVRFVIEGTLAGAVSTVPAAEFDEEPLNARLRDLEWLGPRAAAHQEVNARLLDLSEALVPLAFGSVYRDEASLHRRLRERADELAGRLEGLRGRAEWVVTVARDEEAALAAIDEGSDALRRLNDEIATSPPGRSYLLRRRLGEVRRQELASRDVLAVREVIEGLGAAAERVFREPLVEGRPGGPIARVSLLVERAHQGAFLEEVGRIEQSWRARGYQVAVTGPWPAYRFGGVPLEPAEARA